MGSKVTLGMVKLWESMLDQAVAPVMSQVKMVESRGTVLARYQIEDEYGITKLREALRKAEAVVEEIETRLLEQGIETSRKYPNRSAKRVLENAIEERAKSFCPPEVLAWVAGVQSAKEDIRLAALPEQVKGILESVRDSGKQILPALVSAEVKVGHLISVKNPDETDED